MKDFNEAKCVLDKESWTQLDLKPYNIFQDENTNNSDGDKEINSDYSDFEDKLDLNGVNAYLHLPDSGQ